jgi:4-hydroxybenzoate polyprenyltransferase
MGLGMSSLVQKFRIYADLVKFEHTVFALPFALSAMLLAAPYGEWPSPETVCWILFAMVGGRTYAMGLNRILDAKIDAKNPRTCERAIPAGRVKPLEAWLLTIISGLILTFATFQLPVICQQLLPLAFAMLTLYSLMKRFSNLSHLVLGLALGSSAIGGWLAVTGSFDHRLPVLFGLAVLFWVAGFDLIYACQDVEFDRQECLHSLPATLGTARALKLSRLCHLLAMLSLIGFGWLYANQAYTLGWGYWLGTVLMAILLVYEHSLVSPDDLSKVDAAFFAVNGQVSLSLFALILMDKLFQIFQTDTLF